MSEFRVHQFLRFLKNQIGLAESDLKLALADCGEVSCLPITLWQRGLVTLPELDQMMSWLFSA
ncbi:MAG: DUF2949 domain-containing protein [Leptolyngbyaceae cyanobacterium bins.59]|nr:DUF2949 domain-containing protein [Leptolyngbyaceae cyanobacterium bins.59]